MDMKTRIAALAAAHVGIASVNLLAQEFHSFDVPWWNDLVTGPAKPIVDHGFITLSDAPGLGIDELNDEVIAEHRDEDPEFYDRALAFYEENDA